MQLCTNPGELYSMEYNNCSEYAVSAIGMIGQDKSNSSNFELPQGGTLVIRLYALPVLSVLSTSLEFKVTEKTGLPEFSTFNNGWLMMEGSKYRPGQLYYVCTETTLLNTNKSWYNPIETCASIRIQGFVPQFVDPTPANGSIATAYAGKAIELMFAVQTTVVGGCNYALAQGGCWVIEPDASCVCQENCTGSCKCMSYCAPGPTPLLSAVPGLSNPKSSSGLPMESTWARQSTSSLDRPQVWKLSWTPTIWDRSAAPVRMCFEASLTRTGSPLLGQTILLCVGIRVEKCRHYVQAGDTLDNVAAVFQRDWLTLYHANPNLPGFNPTRLTPGDLIRLGVNYAVRWGEGTSQVSRNFLLTPHDLYLTNPELVATVQLSSTIKTAQNNVELQVSFVPRRTIVAGENVTISLPDFAGGLWAGQVSATCSSSYLVAVYSFCDPLVNRPNQPCGPGSWGHCAYNQEGKLYCSMPQCVGTGLHPLVEGAAWSGAGQELVLKMKRTLAGELVHVVIPQSSGLRKLMDVKPPLEYVAALPVQEKIYNPVSEMLEQNYLCVILPLCQDGLTCLFGTDCRIQPSTWA